MISKAVLLAFLLGIALGAPGNRPPSNTKHQEVTGDSLQDREDTGPSEMPHEVIQSGFKHRKMFVRPEEYDEEIPEDNVDMDTARTQQKFGHSSIRPAGIKHRKMFIRPEEYYDEIPEDNLDMDTARTQQKVGQTSIHPAGVKHNDRNADSANIQEDELSDEYAEMTRENASQDSAGLKPKVSPPQGMKHETIQHQGIRHRVVQPEGINDDTVQPEAIKHNNEFVKTTDEFQEDEYDEQGEMSTDNDETGSFGIKQGYKVIQPQGIKHKVILPTEIKHTVIQPTEIKHKVNQPKEIKHKVNEPTEIKHKVNQPTEIKHKVNEPTEIKHKVNQPIEIKHKVVPPAEFKQKLVHPTGGKQNKYVDPTDEGQDESESRTEPPPTATFEAFYPREAYGIPNSAARAPHGHATFYKYRNPALVDTKNAAAYGFRFDGMRRFNYD